MQFIDRSRRRLLVLAAAGLLVAAFAVPAFAQNATPEGSDPTSESTSEQTPRQERHAARHAAFAEALSEELDLPVDQVTEALTTVRERLREERMDARRDALQERLDDAVANGDLTQEQADAILNAAEAGVLRGRRGFGGGRHHPHGFGGKGWFGEQDASDTDPVSFGAADEV